MYLDNELKTLLIENHVSSTNNIITFMIKIKNQIINYVPNYFINDI